MKTEIRNVLPGYRVNEYRLVLQPHEELRNRITQVKKEIEEKWEVPVTGIRSQLTLATFTQYSMMEERIINRLRIVAMGATPFKVELRDFGSYPSHSLFINVVSKIPVQSLVKLVRQETQRLMKLNDENKPHFILEPHIAVARKLQPWQYEKSWQEFSHRSFSGKFIADSMILLKRPLGELAYQPAAHFLFQNMPVATRQGQLFG